MPADTSRSRFTRFITRWRAGEDIRKRDDDKDQRLIATPEQRRRYFVSYRAWIWPHRWNLAWIMSMALVGIGVDLLWPLVQIAILDGVVLNPFIALNDKESQILFWAGLMVTLTLLGSLLNLRRNIRVAILNSTLAFSLRRMLFNRILRLPLPEVQVLKTGGVISRLSNDVDNTTGLLQMAVFTPTLATIRLVLTLCLMFTINWKISVVTLTLMPPIMILHARWVRRIRPMHKSMSADRQSIDGRVSEAMGGLRVVRGFGREIGEELAYMVGHHTVVRKQVFMSRVQSTIGLVWDLLMPLIMISIVCFGGWMVIKGQATVGVITAFIGFAWRLIEPVMSIVNSISDTQRGLAGMERVFDLLEKPAEKPDRHDATVAPTDIRELRFANVDFSYIVGRAIITSMELTVNGGWTVALVGPSGAGKTTITDLVARFHDPTGGAILLNGVDVRDFQLTSYRSLLGMVQQETFLFDGTIRENIAYARPEATDAEVKDAARRANAEEFIVKLPDGYDSVIGERGVKLSGGQRQRLSIARAILANPRILILDEATSNLDTESERLIQASMAELLKDRTTFVIAHRLSTIIHADLIVVIENGRIVEHGRHDGLMAQGGAYRAMVDRQRTSGEDSAAWGWTGEPATATNG